MVHCPQCGAVNPDEVKHCGKCGTALPARDNGMRCPMCAHSNPPGRETCERCNARLSPLVASSSEETVVPASPPTPTPSEALPSETPAAKGDETVEGDSDWLRHMRDSVVSEDWEAKAEPEPSTEPSSPPAYSQAFFEGMHLRHQGESVLGQSQHCKPFCRLSRYLSASVEV